MENQYIVSIDCQLAINITQNVKCTSKLKVAKKIGFSKFPERILYM